MSITGSDLFDNPMVENLKQTLPSEYIQHHAALGEELFKMDFEKGMMETPDDVQEILQQLTAMLKSGMQPYLLSTEEKFFLGAKLGDEWYRQFGFTKADLVRLNL